MAHLFIFGLGYTAKRVRALAEAQGWSVAATGSAGEVAFNDVAAVEGKIAKADAVLSSAPPADGADPVLARYGKSLTRGRLFYLSSTGVYGDTKGAWVDESALTGTGRRTARSDADAKWLDLGAHVFRLPGIYGPGRSVFERIEDGRAQRIDLPGQVFSRIHVDDIARGVMAAMTSEAPPGPYNLADDMPTSQNVLIEHACELMGVTPPPLVTLEEAGLSDMARGFYTENRRVANGKAKRLLGWSPRYPTFREGLAAIRNA